MRRHEQRVIVTEKHEVVVRLPSDFPPGEAEVVVLSRARATDGRIDLDRWLDAWAAALPAAPALPLSAIGRDSIYP